MKPAATFQRPRFFWQGLMIILPVVTLALVGLYSLRQDEQVAEQTARRRAAENAASLARSLRLAVGDQLTQYIVLQRVWVQALRSAALPTSFVSQSTNAMQRAREQVLPWEKAHPGLQMDRLAESESLFSPEGGLDSPPPVAIAPEPPDWFLELTPAQRAAWESLRKCQSKDEAPSALAEAWRAFLDSEPSKAAQLAASNYARLDSPSAIEESDSGFSESGLRFSDLACLRALDHPARNPRPAAMFADLMNNVLLRPTFLTTAILQKAAEKPPDDPVALEEFRLVQKIWDLDCLARQRAEPFVRNPGLLTSNLWTSGPAGEALALPFEPGFTPDSIPRRHRTNMCFLPLPVLTAIFGQALAENQFLVPDYSTPVISVEGRTLAVSAFARPSEETSLLAEASQQCGEPPGGAALNFQVALYTSRGRMLAAEQRRAHLFGALIGAVVLTAVAGLLAARRAFYQQHRLSEMKSNFVSSVSHELRAPVASMRLLSEALARGKVSEPAKQQEYYRFLVWESRRLTSLIENVLDFSRIEQGRKEYRFEPADLGALAAQTVQLLLPYAAERQVALEWRPGPGPAPELCCDGPALQQALINLIDNAVKHSPAGAVVDIGLESDAAVVRLWVEDRGLGIPPEEHGRIFERFYRRGSELRRETQGIGIGLTIVKHIVEAHRGRVVVRSASGQGSRFTIELPCKEEYQQ